MMRDDLFLVFFFQGRGSMPQTNVHRHSSEAASVMRLILPQSVRLINHWANKISSHQIHIGRNFFFTFSSLFWLLVIFFCMRTHSRNIIKLKRNSSLTDFIFAKSTCTFWDIQDCIIWARFVWKLFRDARSDTLVWHKSTLIVSAYFCLCPCVELHAGKVGR